ncbi:MAG: FtsW/RodA/SpoVE family cell cycle protein [Oscillospiraceae bacterium]|nr:FtsW/RodA/SpoVE family cell cycle protein [Oscillospiraceae bacterium]
MTPAPAATRRRSLRSPTGSGISTTEILPSAADAPERTEYVKNKLQSVGSLFRRLDHALLIPVTLCGAVSVLMLYVMYARQVTDEVDSNDWLVQLISMGLGLAGCMAVSAMDYRKLAKFWFLYAPAALALVGLTFTSLGYGREGADDRNWIDLKFIQLQPSEILKLVFLLTFSYHISKVHKRMNRPGQLLLLLLHAAVPMGIVAVQGDYGTAIIFAAATVFMLFAAGISVWYILAGCAMLPVGIWFIWNHVFGDVHRGRILVLIHPGTDPLGLEYQQDLGLRAIRAGGLLGQGLRAENYVSVPEMHNDFIFAFIAQAFGFVGAAAVILLLAVICLRIFSDSRTAKDTMGKTICMGVFAVMFTHCLLNIGMVLKVMPVIGVPLPFFSAGGTAMVSMYLCIGLAVSAYTHSVRKYRVFYDAEPEQ